MLTLYFAAGSPPARACLLLLRNLGLDVKVKAVDLAGGEQKTDEFTKINPVGLVPVLVDGDFVLSESRAILAYLVNSRKPGSSLYPSDPKKRALVDQRLYYDATTLFLKLTSLVRPIIFGGQKTISQESIDNITNVLTVLEGFLENNAYFAGDELTIADFSILTTITTFYVRLINSQRFSTSLNFNYFRNLVGIIANFQI
jgi:glutathione S-transferase